MDVRESPELIGGTRDSGGRRGGWITTFFMGVGMTGLKLAGGGWHANLIVYLIREFNMKNIEATQVSNVVSSCISLTPVLAAIFSDSFLGCFPVIILSSFTSLLGTALLLLTVITNSLILQPYCELGLNPCKNSPTVTQFAALYAGIALATMGAGGTSSTIATFGADQFDNPNDQATFFHWYFFILYATIVINGTVIVYVQESVSWAWGFGICVAANLMGIAFFLLGNRFYHHVKPKGSPFTGLARVVVASIQKRTVQVSGKGSEDYYHGCDEELKLLPSTPSEEFSFFNRAALKAEGDTRHDGSITTPWRLCTVQQVEDCKALLRIFPIWSSGIFLSTPISLQSSLVVLQALTMDRHVTPHFEVPAGSFSIIVFTISAIFLPIIARILRRRHLTVLQRVGIGHVLNIAGMATSAAVGAVEAQRRRQSASTPVPAWWLVPPLAVVGLGEAFHYPGRLEFCYQEFPAAMKGMATAVSAVVLGIGFYLSSGLIELIRRSTGWLVDDINQGRVDCVYWVLVGIGVVNFGYFLICCKLYKSPHPKKIAQADDS